MVSKFDGSSDDATYIVKELGSISFYMHLGDFIEVDFVLYVLDLTERRVFFQFLA